eukprot:2776919-Amphidinium_carterae.1
MDGDENTAGQEHLARLRRYGLLLNLLPEEFKRDRDIVLAAVSLNGNALQYAADKCKQNREIVLTAVRANGRAL